MSTLRFGETLPRDTSVLPEVRGRYPRMYLAYSGSWDPWCMTAAEAACFDDAGEIHPMRTLKLMYKSANGRYVAFSFSPPDTLGMDMFWRYDTQNAEARYLFYHHDGRGFGLLNRLNADLRVRLKRLCCEGFTERQARRQVWRRHRFAAKFA